MALLQGKEALATHLNDDLDSYMSQQPAAMDEEPAAAAEAPAAAAEPATAI